MSATIKVILNILNQPPCFLRFLVSWFLTITVFTWLININLLVYILASPELTGAGKLAFISSAYGNYFRYIDNPIALTSILFSLLIAINLTLLWYLWRELSQKARLTKHNSGALAAMLGADCVSCGRSLGVTFNIDVCRT